MNTSKGWDKDNIKGFVEGIDWDTKTSALSFTNLLEQESFKKAYLDGDVEEYNKLLWSVGVDTTKGYEVVYRLHRPMGRITPLVGEMLIYYERTDKHWVKTPYASIDAIIDSSDDLYLKGDLRAMQKAYLSLGETLDLMQMMNE